MVCGEAVVALGLVGLSVLRLESAVTLLFSSGESYCHCICLVFQRSDAWDGRVRP